VRLSSMGDVVLATSVVGSLRERLPDCRISFLTRAAYGPLLEHHPCVDEVLIAPGRSASLAGWARYGAGLRGRRFDALIDLQYNWRTLALALGMQPIRVRRWDRAHFARRSMVRRGAQARAVAHVVERFH